MSTPFDPAVEARFHELIGILITQWSRIHETVVQQTTSIQMWIYLQQKRDWYKKKGGDSWTGSVGDALVFPEKRWRLYLKYFIHLSRAARGNDQDHEIQLQRATSKLHKLYKIRNDLAHGQLSINIMDNPPTATFRTSEWVHEWLDGEIERSRPKKWLALPLEDRTYQALQDAKRKVKKPEPMERTYTLDELSAALREMQDVFAKLHRLNHHDPSIVPVAPKVPVS
ncbi:hypothetical protein [Sphingomonas trueperi]|uniref:Uncharacterized protein n=1 Tax=Sphingomonas trueperi TaxID=53317 RepID=A0A7X5Y3B9_9SPHN|nr:hypothetical protein [Sphingomonas trueperi]NJB99880.1 hypothetical protein [Sphingomonas trueperi]